jgi:hypothetical protein
LFDSESCARAEVVQREDRQQEKGKVS